MRIIVSGSKLKCGYLIQWEELAGSDYTPIIELKG
jgi:quercetin dioxygenase-like cupin family protein